MTTKISDILYNPGSIHTCGPVSQDELATQRSSDLVTDDDFTLLSLLEQIIQGESEAKLESDLFHFHLALSEGVSKGLRPILLKEFNLFLARASTVYAHNTHILQHGLHIITEIKRQIDRGGTSFMNQAEWVELEKSLYYLTHWEEGVHCDEYARRHV